MAENTEPDETLDLPRTLKLGSFHIGSALADILILGVWNRILITDLAIAATPVSLLAALRYLVAPLTILAGYQSDTRPRWGKFRLPYIYFGRLLTWLSLPLLPVVVSELAQDRSSVVGWLLALGVFLLYGIGTQISGAPFLALVRESAPPSKQGLAVVVVQTMLLLGFSTVPIVYSLLIDEYTPAAFWRVVGIAMVGAAFTWLWSVWGEEKAKQAAPTETVPFRQLFQGIWSQGNTRTFFGLLAMGSIALFAQDAVLEPMGGDLFGLDVGETTRFSAYYGTGVLLAMLVGSRLTRRWRPQQYRSVTALGLWGIVAGLILLIVTALGHIEALLVPALFVFGIGSGIYTVGGLNLMIAMTGDSHPGAYLGIWSMVQLVFRGLGIAIGGIARDLGAALTGSPEVGYTLVFAIQIGTALLALIFLQSLFQRGLLRPTTPAVLSPQQWATGD